MNPNPQQKYRYTVKKIFCYKFLVLTFHSCLDAGMVKSDPDSDTEEEEERERADLDDPDFDPLEEEFSVQLSYKKAK